MPKVSVIIGIYNCAPYLQEALDSLYAQTFQDFEIILCEDGSSDNTYEIALENQKNHSNIVLLKNPHNLGLNQTLNNCLAVAKGEYIARMDGDDISVPNRFEVLTRFLDEHPEYDFVTSQMQYFDADGVFRVGKGEGEPKITDFPKHTPFNHAPCMVRKYAYDAVGGYTVDERLLREEDYELWIKMYKHGFKGYTLNEPLYMMRDDRNATLRRNMKARKNEAYVKHLAVKEFDLPFYYNVHCLKPLILGMMPTLLYEFLHRRA